MGIFKIVVVQVLLIVLTAISFMSCKENVYEKDMNILMSKQIRIDVYRMLKVQPAAPINYDTKSDSLSNDHDYSLVVFTDSSKCNSCAAKTLYQWNELIDSLYMRYGNKVNTYFIFEPKQDQRNALKYALEEALTVFPIYIDTLHVFSDSNPNIPVSSIMHTFLIDRVGNVLIVGSPLRSDKIRNLMFQMLDGKK